MGRRRNDRRVYVIELTNAPDLLGPILRKDAFGELQVGQRFKHIGWPRGYAEVLYWHEFELVSKEPPQARRIQQLEPTGPPPKLVPEERNGHVIPLGQVQQSVSQAHSL